MAEQKKLLTIQDLMERWGVSAKTIQRYTKKERNKKHLKKANFGGRSRLVRFHEADVDEFDRSKHFLASLTAFSAYGDDVESWFEPY